VNADLLAKGWCEVCMNPAGWVEDDIGVWMPTEREDARG
jgi:hypothetical protein